MHCCQPQAPNVYLDHAAATPVCPEAMDAVCFAMRRCTANPSAAYSAAGQSRALLRKARQTMADMLEAAPQELFFTCGGTESNNWALRHAAGRHVVLSATEHPSVLLSAENQGCAVTLVSPDSRGIITPQAVEAALRPDTALVSVHLANNETGVLQPIAQIGELTRRRGVLFHCDAVQGFGAMPIRPHQWGVDLLSASSHKIYGPQGAGFLFIRQGMPNLPLLSGGAQEMGRRAGTENLAAIYGFSAAAQLAQQDMAARWDLGQNLRAVFLSALAQAAPDVTQLCADSPRVSGITALLLPAMSAEEMIARLDLLGIAVSGGAACASRSGKPSHVLTAMGLSPKDAERVIRISTGRHTTAEEMVRAANAIGALLSSHEFSMPPTSGIEPLL